LNAQFDLQKMRVGFFKVSEYSRRDCEK
jgi:hypothetical protein